MIATCVQRGNYVEVYNERNSRLCTLQGTLIGYTGSTVSVKRNNYVETYNERGSRISTHYTS